jgi:drug/metabolite transporter (DMT)-like permease
MGPMSLSAAARALVALTPVRRPLPALSILVALATVYLVWGSTFYAIRVALEAWPPLLLGGTRFMTAGAVLYLAARLRGAAAPDARTLLHGALLGVLMFTAGNGLICYAEQHVASALAALITASIPLWVAALGHLLGDDRRSRGEWLAVLVGFIGVATLSGEGIRGAPLSILALVVANAVWAVALIWGRRRPLPPGLMGSALPMLGGGAVLVLLGLLRGEQIGALSTRTWLAWGHLVVLGSMVAFSAFSHLLGRTRPAVATSYAYVNPIVALLIGVGLGGERLGPTALVGTGLVIGSVILTLAPRARTV